MDGQDASRESGAFASAPPVDGLGNYKGVMLCNRPVEEYPARMRGATDATAAPFISAAAPNCREQLGIQPARKLEPRSEVKTRGASAALRRHCQWIKELQNEVADEQMRIADDEQKSAKRKARMQVLFKQQRDAVKDLKSKKEVVDARELVTLLSGPAKAKGIEGKSRSRKSDKKPLWAMSEEERVNAEDDEISELIDFAENLDFDKYIGDAEFRDCLQVVKDRAKKIQKEQERFKDDLVADFNAQVDGDGDEFGSAYTGSPRNSQDGGSILGDLPGNTGAVRRGRGGERPDWDASTNAGDDRPEVDQEARSDAGRVLDAMPQLKGIHSKESVKKVMEKVRGATPQVA